MRVGLGIGLGYQGYGLGLPRMELAFKLPSNRWMVVRARYGLYRLRVVTNAITNATVDDGWMMGRLW